MLTRRQFLDTSFQSTSILSLASSVPCFLTRSLQAAENKKNNGRILVVIELNGGNDGLNTVVPFTDENYRKYRKALRISESKVLKLNPEIGLHPALKDAAKLVEDGRLAVIQGVGYPNPNRSHFESRGIWQSAQPNPKAHGGYGWLGRALDQKSNRAQTFADAICLGDIDPPQALRGRQSTQSTIRNLAELQLDSQSVNADVGSDKNTTDDLRQFVRRRTVDARATVERIAKLNNASQTKTRYPQSGLANRLKDIARLIRAELEPRVYYTVQSGYDTHINQKLNHYRRLSEFSGALNAFLNDLRDSQLDERVLVLVFSEFGRRVAENDSQGTDHGTAGPVFLAGPAVKAGLHGTPPDLADLQDGDLKMTTDFRSVYATILSKWLDINPQSCLQGNFAAMDLLQS
ncbi:DUF1501 domain-containing protein [uncultured Gimesia sp.]|uniref:DUF1501 domain-containing protein n=1 Tax=uncultured Gimesia sp. TaxID=1678688 RepID=UPI0030D8723D|tara:strand:+ start:34245 stop:35456 length:1212 start_codon:yes stop_codon:yes gene_type:complete